MPEDDPNILPFQPRKRNRLGKALESTWRDTLPTDQCYQCGGCQSQEFLLLTTGHVYCSQCGAQSNDLMVVRPK